MFFLSNLKIIFEIVLTECKKTKKNSNFIKKKLSHRGKRRQPLQEQSLKHTSPYYLLLIFMFFLKRKSTQVL